MSTSLGETRPLGRKASPVDNGRMRRRLPLLVVVAARARRLFRQALRMPSAPSAAPSSRSRTRGTSASTSCQSAPNSDEIVRSIGAGGERPRRLRLRPLGGRADRDPDHRRRQAPGEEARLVRVCGRVRPRPVPDPAQREDRRRPLLGRRPARDHRRPRLVPALRALRALPEGRGGWRAGSGAIWNLRSNRLRPAGWTSADAAGLPILPGLARYDEVKRGVIDHALRFTVQRTRRAYVFPARHFASSSTTRACRRWGFACG